MQAKKYKNSFLLGKFMPPTKGHIHLIETAAKHSERVYVLACSLLNESISGELRFNWLCNIFKDNESIKIIRVTDENPQYPEESPEDFWDIWLATFDKHLPIIPDAIFSSETYGIEIAKLMSIEHHMVDLDRTEIPISATKIRNEPFKYWDYIPDVVKPYFSKKIVLLGVESSGKTMMCKRLAEYYKTNWVLEYGRFYTENINDKPDVSDFIRIAKGQQPLNDFGLSKKNKLVFFDTECITTKVFFQLLYPDKADLLDNFFYHFIFEQNFDLYLLLDCDAPFIQDGNRMFENERVKHHEMLKTEMEKKHIPYIEIKGVDYDEKFQNIINILKHYQ